mmetsp:Transcript_43319/g.114000  ORF Transcript_43319/g.114000 Transcript_43319/m.114000 type:complete len:367 (-) Transcript_43319:1849-2949(-)
MRFCALLLSKISTWSECADVFLPPPPLAITSLLPLLNSFSSISTGNPGLNNSSVGSSSSEVTSPGEPSSRLISAHTVFSRCESERGFQWSFRPKGNTAAPLVGLRSPLPLSAAFPFAGPPFGGGGAPPLMGGPLPLLGELPGPAGTALPAPGSPLCGSPVLPTPTGDSSNLCAGLEETFENTVFCGDSGDISNVLAPSSEESTACDRTGSGDPALFPRGSNHPKLNDGLKEARREEGLLSTVGEAWSSSSVVMLNRRRRENLLTRLGDNSGVSPITETLSNVFCSPDRRRGTRFGVPATSWDAGESPTRTLSSSRVGAVSRSPPAALHEASKFSPAGVLPAGVKGVAHVVADSLLTSSPRGTCFRS